MWAWNALITSTTSGTMDTPLPGCTREVLVLLLNPTSKLGWSLDGTKEVSGAKEDGINEGKEEM